MLCLRRFYLSTLRRHHWQCWNSDSLLSQLSNCTTADQVFDLVGRNKTKLSEKHVGTAINLLWNFQKRKPENMRSIDYIKRHSQFLTLCILAENKIESMDDEALVNILYDVLRLRLEAYHSLIQELVMEGWRRLDRLNFSSLSKFALCLYDQDIRHSPLMGHIAEIVNKNLDSLQNIRALSVLMVSISGIISQDFRNKLIQKTEILFETTEGISLSSARRLVHFLRNINLTHHTLLAKCNRAFMENMDKLDVNDIALILGFYRVLHFSNDEFRLVAKQKLMELMDGCGDPFSFSRLFATLVPMAGPLVREQLIETALLMANEFDHRQTLLILESMQEIECRDSHLIQKIVSLLHIHLDKYKPVTLLKMMQFLATHHFPNSDFYFKLRVMLIKNLEINVTPSHISTLVRIMCMIPNSNMDEIVVSRIDAILPQCNLRNLCILAVAVVKWAQRDRLNRQNPSVVYGKLLEKINNQAFYRLQKINSLDLLLEDLKYVSKEWFEEVILEETMIVLQRMLGQITWTNVLDLASILIKTSYLCPPLLDRVAAVTVQCADKIYGPETYSLLQPFTILNYDPPQGEKFFRTCIEKLSSHLDYFEPHRLVQLGFSLATSEYFPENVIKAIFNVEFLRKLDAELETLPDYLSKVIRLRLMNLNRAVCLECPELQIPWFHDNFCQQLQQKTPGSNHLNALQQQIHGLLGEILGGSHFVKVSALCPYYYRIDFEFILDKNKKPLPYRNQSVVMTDLEGLHWGQDGHLLERRELPLGAKRIALEFLDSRDFCKNLNHLKGETAMKKRHLEILGHHVVQIPHFEWNSMELSSKNARKEYLKKKIFETV